MVSQHHVEERRRNALESILERVKTSLSAVDGEFPYFADTGTGQWVTTTEPDWCAGHWIGLLELANYHTGDTDSRLEQAAEEYAKALITHAEKFESSVFAGLNFHYAGFRSYDLRGNRLHYGLGFRGADAMVDLFHEQARQVTSGQFQLEGPPTDRDAEFDYDPDAWTSSGHYASAVDAIYVALPVLWRAYRENAHEQYRDVALSHADRFLDRFVREDGGTRQQIHFDPETGVPVREDSDLGHSVETCWARGHGWAIAGLVRAYNETMAERFLTVLDRIVEFYIDHTPADLVTYWDLQDPAIPDAPRDTSAAVLVAYGLCRLKGDDDRVERLRDVGETVLDSLVDSYLVTPESDIRRGMVVQGCYNKPQGYATNHELIWTDYYLAYTLHDLVT